MQSLLQAWQFIDAAGGDIEDRFLAVCLGFLWKVADHGPFIALDGARVRLLLLEDDGKQRGLAGAVWPDQRDAIAVVHAEGRVFEEHAPAQGHFKISNSKHETNGSSPTDYSMSGQAFRSSLRE